MMSPTININVAGRVGASDTELNDIARKIGQKINIKMNRYGSSGLRVNMVNGRTVISSKEQTGMV